MNPRRLELALDLLREVNAARRNWHRVLGCGCGCDTFVRIAEQQLAQLDADGRARSDSRQLSIYDVLRRQQVRQP